MTGDEIAIVGVGCRFPGGVRDTEALWRVFSEGLDLTGEVPADRWDAARFHDTETRRPGTTYCPRGAFLDDVDRFDAGFFGITAREAAEMDPQQRVLLETAWAAMEDSGIPRGDWNASRTGVFIGILAMDYTVLHAKTLGPRAISPYYATGKEFSFGAGRIAYTFGLQGPCVMLSTACSSSLMAVHLASQALRAGECDRALAGGVNLMLTPELSVFMSKIDALSPSATCRPFDAAADGVVRGEGCGVIVLRRYADAVRDGDRIWAVVRGSAANHDGRSAGLTAPNAEAQEALVRSALERAGIHPARLDYVEAHGTGTPLGDPIELSALSASVGAHRAAGRPLFVGSHKANFGHLDSAAGMLGLLKAALVARRRVVPPQIHLDRPTPMIEWSRSGLEVATAQRPITRRGPVFTGVSAFGLSGSNVHVVVGSPPTPAAARTRRTEAADGAHKAASATASAPPAPPVLTISAPTPRALEAQVAAYRDRILAADEAETPDLLYSAAVRRTHHDHRLAVVGRTREQLAGALDAALAKAQRDGAGPGAATDGRPPRIVHVFTGQGSQYAEMGVELYRRHAAVRETFDACDALFREHAGWSLLEELRRGQASSRLAETEFAQPTIFALQVALSRLWAQWGLRPDAVLGHSMGEIAAAHVAGSLDLESAARLILHRGRIMSSATGSGRMAAVELPEPELAPLLAQYGGRVCIAAVNGPRSTVVAGPADDLDALLAELRRRAVVGMPLGVDYAFHSPAVHTHGDELESVLAGVLPPVAAAESASEGGRTRARAPKVTMLSSVDPEVDRPVTDAAYWGRNVREPVRFWPAVDRYLDRDDVLFVEIGPHPVLTRPLQAAAKHRNRSAVTVISGLKRGESAIDTLASALAVAYQTPATIDWTAVHGPRGRYVPLPPIPLGGDRYWLAGVERGQQDSGSAIDAANLRAEVRLFDADGALVASLAGASTGSPAVSPAPSSAPPALSAAPFTARPDSPAPPSAAPGATPRSPLSASNGHTPGAQPAPQPPAAADVTSPGVTAAAGLGRERIADVVGSILAEILGYAPGERISRVRGFYELGMDSFTLTEFGKRLSTQFGLDLDESAGIDHPTVDQMTDYIAAASATAAANAAPAAVTPTPAAVAPAPAPLAPPTSSPAPTILATEPVAIVGMSCRLPGADGLEEFWDLLRDGVDATGDVPLDRWDADELPLSDSESPGTVATRRGAFLSRVDGFDNAFFRISAREARSMDPQQRLFLEVAWEALEDAGLDAQVLRGGPTGLFVGLNTTDYQQLVTRYAENVDLYYGTGNSFSGTAGRLSYFLGVRGPSMAIDTACSSSLAAVHLGCQSLRSGESEVVIAGGSNVIAAPTVYLAMSAGGALSSDGRCKTFDASADGYGRGEGAVALVLKTLSRAEADGDRVYAVIRGSAVNHNGASGGLTVPDGKAQQEVIRTALTHSGVDASEIDYVEAHGTGTPLGDAVELGALAGALGDGRTADRPLLVGSVKTNIGHLEAAAGAAGLVKTVLALGRGEIPAHLNCPAPTGRIARERLPLRIAVQPTPWPTRKTGARTAGISAFGFTGTNAHVVVSEPKEASTASTTNGPAISSPSDQHTRPLALAVSAATPAALAEAADRLRARIEAATDAEAADICYTAGARRTHLDHRMVVVGTTRDELVAALRSQSAGYRGEARTGEPRRVALVFGETIADLPLQWLDDNEPAFHAALDAAQAETEALLGRSIRQALNEGALSRRGDAARHGDTPAWPETVGHGDPVALLAVQIALTALWRDHGIVPDALVGRGIGEIAAAHAAGICGLRDAILAASGVRGIELSGTATTALFLNSLGATVRPGWTPPSGAGSAQWSAELIAAVMGQGTEIVLDVGLGPDAARLAQAEAEAESAGLLVVPDLAQLAATDGSGHIVTPAESAASPASGSHTPESAAAPGDSVAPPSFGTHVAAWLHAVGCRVDWKLLVGGRGRVVSLPAYPWQRRRHWIDVPALASTASGARGDTHPYLGEPFVPFDTPRLRYYPLRIGAGTGANTRPGNAATATTPATSVTSATADGFVAAPRLIEAMLGAASDLLPGGAIRLRGFALSSPLIAAADVAAPAGAQILATRRDDGWSLRLLSMSASDGQAGIPGVSADRPGRAPSEDVQVLRTRLSETADSAAPPAAFEPGALLIDAPGDFAAAAILGTGAERLAEYQVGDARGHYCLSPGVLGVALRLLASCVGCSTADPLVVSAVDSVSVYGAPRDSVLVHAIAQDPLGGQVRILDSDGAVLVALGGVRFARASEVVVSGDLRERLARSLYAIRWQQLDLPVPAPRAETGPWLICAGAPDTIGTVRRIAAGLRAGGAEVTTAGGPGAAPVDVSLDPSDPAAWSRLLKQTPDQRIYDNMVIVTAPAGPGAGAGAGVGTDRDADVVTRTTPVLLAARELAAAPGNGPGPALWVLTSGAVEPDLDGGDRGDKLDHTRPIAPAQAAVWGLGRVLAMELANRWAGLIDVPPNDTGMCDAAQIRAVVTRLLAGPPTSEAANSSQTPDIEDELCLRDGTWFAPRLGRLGTAPHALPSPTAFCRPDRWYVMTDAAAAANRPITDWLVGLGVRRLLDVTTGPRDDGSGELAARRAELEQAGVEVRSVVAADGAQKSDLKMNGADRVWAGVAPGAPGAVNGSERNWLGVAPGALGGVIVAPLPTPARPLAETEPEHLAAQLGHAALARRLDQAARGTDLDFFLLTGSAAAQWGTIGAAGRAAGEGALDALAAARRSAGLPVQTIRWMPREDTGELTRRDRILMQDCGLQPLDAAGLAQALDVVARSGIRDAALADVNEAAYVRACRERAPRALLADLGAAGPGTDEATDQAAQDGPRRTALSVELAQLPPGARDDRLLDFVLDAVIEVLGDAPDAGGIAPTQGFFDLGMDSIMSLSLKNRLETELGTTLPATLTFEFPTPAALTAHLLEALGEAETQARDGADPGAPGLGSGGPALAQEPVISAAEFDPELDAPAPMDELSDPDLMDRLRLLLADSESLLGEDGA